MLKYISSIFKTKTLKDSAISLIGTGINAVISILTLAFLARTLTPADFGIFSASRNTILLLGGLLNFGFSSWLIAVLKPNDPKQQAEKLSQVVSLTLSLGLIGAVILLIFSNFRFNFIATDNFLTYLFVLIAAVIMPLFQAGLAVYQSRLAFITKNMFEVSWNLIRLILYGLFFWFLTFNSLTAVGLMMLSWIIGLILMFYSLKLEITFTWPTIPVIKSIFGFSSWLGLNQVVITLYGRFNVLFLTTVLPVTQLAIFAAADQLGNFFPIMLTSIAAVIAPRFSQFPSLQIAKNYSKKTFILSLGLALFFLLIAFLAPPIIKLLLSDRYLQSLPVLQLLAIANIPLALAITPVNRLIYFHQKTKPIFYFSVIQLIVLIGYNLLNLSNFNLLTPAWGLLIANSVGLILPTAYLWLNL